MTPTLLTGRLLLSTLAGRPTVPCGWDSNVIGEGKGHYRVRWAVRVKGLISVPYIADVYVFQIKFSILDCSITISHTSE